MRMNEGVLVLSGVRQKRLMRDLSLVSVVQSLLLPSALIAFMEGDVTVAATIDGGARRKRSSNGQANELTAQAILHHSQLIVSFFTPTSASLGH